MLLGQNLRPLCLYKKIGFSKTAGKRSLVVTHKTQKSEGCEPHSILPKPQNCKEMTPRRYLQNFKKIVEIQQSSWYLQPKFQKTSIFKSSGEATFSRYPQKKAFEKQGGDA